MKLQKQPIRTPLRIVLRHHAYYGEPNGKFATRYMQPSFHDWCMWQMRQRLCSEQGTEQETVNVSMTGLLGNHTYWNQMFVW
jgi:hypothetical protein